MATSLRNLVPEVVRNSIRSRYFVVRKPAGFAMEVSALHPSLERSLDVLASAAGLRDLGVTGRDETRESLGGPSSGGKDHLGRRPREETSVMTGSSSSVTKKRWHFVEKLDLDTDGLVIVCRDAHLANAMRQAPITRRYRALCDLDNVRPPAASRTAHSVAVPCSASHGGRLRSQEAQAAASAIGDRVGSRVAAAAGSVGSCSDELNALATNPGGPDVEGPGRLATRQCPTSFLQRSHAEDSSSTPTDVSSPATISAEASSGVGSDPFADALHSLVIGETGSLLASRPTGGDPSGPCLSGEVHVPEPSNFCLRETGILESPRLVQGPLKLRAYFPEVVAGGPAASGSAASSKKLVVQRGSAGDLARGTSTTSVNPSSVSDCQPPLKAAVSDRDPGPLKHVLSKSLLLEASRRSADTGASGGAARGDIAPLSEATSFLGARDVSGRSIEGAVAEPRTDCGGSGGRGSHHHRRPGGPAAADHLEFALLESRVVKSPRSRSRGPRGRRINGGAIGASERDGGGFLGSCEARLLRGASEESCGGAGSSFDACGSRERSPCERDFRGSDDCYDATPAPRMCRRPDESGLLLGYYDVSVVATPPSAFAAHRVRAQLAEVGAPVLFDRYYHAQWNGDLRRNVFQGEGGNGRRLMGQPRPERRQRSRREFPEPAAVLAAGATTTSCPSPGEAASTEDRVFATEAARRDVEKLRQFLSGERCNSGRVAAAAAETLVASDDHEPGASPWSTADAEDGPESRVRVAAAFAVATTGGSGDEAGSTTKRSQSHIEAREPPAALTSFAKASPASRGTRTATTSTDADCAALEGAVASAHSDDRQYLSRAFPQHGLALQLYGLEFPDPFRSGWSSPTHPDPRPLGVSPPPSPGFPPAAGSDAPLPRRVRRCREGPDTDAAPPTVGWVQVELEAPETWDWVGHGRSKSTCDL